MNKVIRISRVQDRVKSVCIAIILVLVFIFSTTSLELDINKFVGRLSNTGTVINRLMTLNFTNIIPILLAMLSSIAIAICSLTLGFIIAVIISFLAAENTSPNKILSSAIKGIIAIIRAVPALVWILMIVASVGFGNTGGMIGLIFPTVGYLTKSFTASIEDLGNNTIEAMKTTGANKFTIIIKGLIPSLIHPFISWIAIRLEGNIAESITLGMVGVGGIGSMLMKALGKYEYGTISTIILVIFTTLFIVELLVNKLKSII